MMKGYSASEYQRGYAAARRAAAKDIAALREGMYALLDMLNEAELAVQRTENQPATVIRFSDAGLGRQQIVKKGR
jgi:hypothetical protein